MRFKLFLETDERKLRYLRRVTDHLNIDPRLFIATTILIERDFIEKSKKLFILHKTLNSLLQANVISPAESKVRFSSILQAPQRSNVEDGTYVWIVPRLSVSNSRFIKRPATRTSVSFSSDCCCFYERRNFPRDSFPSSRTAQRRMRGSLPVAPDRSVRTQQVYILVYSRVISFLRAS